MAKLSRKISSNNNNNNDDKKNKISFSLSTKTNNQNETVENTDNQEVTNIANKIEIPQNNKELEKFFFEKTNLLKLSEIDKTLLEQLVSAENQLTNEQIKSKIFSNVFNDKFLQNLRIFLDEYVQKNNELIAENQELTEKQRKQEIFIKNLQSQIEDTEEQIFKIERKFADTVPVADLISFFITSKIQNQHTKKINELLAESFKNSGKNGQKFAMSFLKGFAFIEDAILSLGDDEKENLDILHNATTKFLSEITETNAPERRPLLDIIATLCNSYLTAYDFISPEQTLQIDPLIHNAEGIGGTVVKEGQSFAVVRRDTRKTVYYADIFTK
jgi:hypothetical protein